MKRVAILALLLASPALAAQETDTLTDDDKSLYLKCAYVLNKNSMVRPVELGSIDLSKWSQAELRLCIEPPPSAAPATAPAHKKTKGPSR